MNFIFNIEKAKSAVLFITNQLGQSDLLRIFKILYFADQKHLSKYGRPIIADKYIAMKNGPVPSYIYDLFKVIRGDEYLNKLDNTFVTAFKFVDNNYTIKPQEEANLEYLSKSDISCLEDAIRENRALTFSQLSEKSHDTAWINATKDDHMDIIQIAIAGGANEEMVKYIIECSEYNDIEIV